MLRRVLRSCAIVYGVVSCTLCSNYCCVCHGCWAWLSCSNAAILIHHVVCYTLWWGILLMRVVVPCTLHVDEYCSSHVRVSCIVEKCVEIMTSRGCLHATCQDVGKSIEACPHLTTSSISSRHPSSTARSFSWRVGVDFALNIRATLMWCKLGIQ